MASASATGALPPNFFLTPQQQGLLFAALNSNRQAGAGSNAAAASANGAMSLSPSSMENSPQQKDGIQESPYLDNYDYDFGPDSSFDFDFSGGDQPKMIGDIPGSARSESADNDGPDKRSHPDDEDDEGSPEKSDSAGNGAKRRESTEKTPKKPGRKPLTTEPSSKRKAQNRAAQRAFRERKEKHLKDLETKVEELEKASEVANSENSILRAQVERITTELNEYKKRVTALSSNTYTVAKKQASGPGFGSAAVNNLSDVNFQFEFPKFGMLPGPPVKQQPSRSSTSMSPSAGMPNSNPVSPLNSQSPIGLQTDVMPKQQTKSDFAVLSNVFSPALSNNSLASVSRASLDSNHYSVGPTATSSPSASSNSNTGPSSSCGTSPEPFTQSPMGFKPVDTLTTIGEEQPAAMGGGSQAFSHFEGIDINSAGFDWLAQQNGGHFDPQLFSDYREPQESVLANASFDDSFFNDALDADFFTPYNIASASPAVSKKSLIAEIDAKQNADDEEAVTAAEKMDCTKMWEKLQNCPKVQSGEFDLDSLCSELQKKAKCSGNGPVVAEKDFQAVVEQWMGKKCAENAATRT